MAVSQPMGVFEFAARLVLPNENRLSHLPDYGNEILVFHPDVLKIFTVAEQPEFTI
jgi:hypothetical protein